MLTPALVFIAVVVMVVADADIAFELGLLPGGTITRGVKGLAARHPVAWRLGYVALAAVGFWHFFTWGGW